MNRPLFKPGQILLTGPKAYEIIGVYLGGENTQNLVAMAAIGMPFTAISGIRTTEVCVPEEILLSLLAQDGGQLFEAAFPMQKKLEIAKNALMAVQKAEAGSPETPTYTRVTSALMAIEQVD